MLRYVGIYTIVLFTLVQFSECQIPFLGKCPNVTVVNPFDLDKYMGTWYEYSKYPFLWEMGKKCQQAVYKNEGNGTVSVVNSGVFVIFNIPKNAKGTAKVLAPGELFVAFHNHTVSRANYLILGTDYNSWAVVYSCKNNNLNSHTKSLWILTRERVPSDATVAAAEKVIADNELQESLLIKTIQTNCPDKTKILSDEYPDVSFTDPNELTTEPVTDVA